MRTLIEATKELIGVDFTDPCNALKNFNKYEVESISIEKDFTHSTKGFRLFQVRFTSKTDHPSFSGYRIMTIDNSYGEGFEVSEIGR